MYAFRLKGKLFQSKQKEIFQILPELLISRVSRETNIKLELLVFRSWVILMKISLLSHTQYFIVMAVISSHSVAVNRWIDI